jgi:hypothetical protein
MDGLHDVRYALQAHSPMHNAGILNADSSKQEDDEP